MKRVLARRLVAVACLGTFAIISTACLPNGSTLPPVSGNGSTCPVGTWQLASETIPSSLQTLLGGATVTTSGTGITLQITSSNQWTLSANQTLTVSGSNFNVTGSVNASATGSDTTSASDITFTLNNITGTINVNGTVGTQSFSGSWPVGQSDDIQKLYGLSGTATYSCSGGSLTLSLPTMQMDFNQ
jgi:hypothetical protein